MQQTIEDSVLMELMSWVISKSHQILLSPNLFSALEKLFKYKDLSYWQEMPAY